MSTSPEQPAALRDGDLTAPALAALGLGPQVAALLRAAADGVPARAAGGADRRAARVVRVDRGRAHLATADGAVAAATRTLAGRRAGVEGALVTGDWVVWARDADEGPAVVARLAPATALVRRVAQDDLSQQQELATWVDVVAVVVPLDVPVSAGRLERTLAVAWESGARPLVVATKADVVADTGAERELLERSAAGAEVLLTSTATGAGLEKLRAAVGAGTLALLGPSGAGKSSLVNALVGEEVQAVGAVRGGDGRGRHTTTARELVPLPGGGVLLDTPGVRGLGLWETADGVDRAFEDVAALAARCRFADCSHSVEPGCAVTAALESGELPERRWRSHQKLQREAAALAVRHDERLRREQARAFSKRVRLTAGPTRHR
ncbi:ribosome small subunit-dependent GTPase A [Pseudokineococcus sp. 5B2Z-1]|uniref:ribosome small subunit-dependent GTPase A n=1 Tax=Pseudokineococcus sp. 5B2Z-1 TaxID=3132744 RepID=UPI0030A4157D